MRNENGHTDFSIAMTRSQMAIAETIDAFYGDAGANDGVSRSYKQAVADLDAETIKALDGPYRYVVPMVLGIDPLTTQQNDCTRTNFKVLCLLPRYQRV